MTGNVFIKNMKNAQPIRSGAAGNGGKTPPCAGRE